MSIVVTRAEVVCLSKVQAKGSKSSLIATVKEGFITLAYSITLVHFTSGTFMTGLEHCWPAVLDCIWSDEVLIA